MLTAAFLRPKGSYELTRGRTKFANTSHSFVLFEAHPNLGLK